MCVGLELVFGSVYLRLFSYPAKYTGSSRRNIKAPFKAHGCGEAERPSHYPEKSQRESWLQLGSRPKERKGKKNGPLTERRYKTFSYRSQRVKGGLEAAP